MSIPLSLLMIPQSIRWSMTKAAIIYISEFGINRKFFESVILEAQNRIIFRYSWVADGLSGRILDKGRNITEEFPQFSELFSADRDESLLPVAVALSYYAPLSDCKNNYMKRSLL